MTNENRQSCAQKLSRYGRKYDQHACRVRLSYRLASSALRPETFAPDSDIERLAVEAFPEVAPGVRHQKLQQGLSEAHLLALKADFELFFNRVLTVLWSGHFNLLAIRMREAKVPGVGEAALSAGATPDAVDRLIAKARNLTELTNWLKIGTGIEVPTGVTSLDPLRWSQIWVACQVRNLIEHRDGKVDTGFLKNVGRTDWNNSSWGRGQDLPALTKRIRVGPEDVEKTADAMREVARLLTDALVRWDSAQP